MTADPILTLFLPIALGIIMLGLGLSLTPADFLRVVRYPKPVLVGLVCQIVLLPMACFLIVQGFALEAAAIGMEIGIHNGTLAIALALSPSLLNNSTMAIPPAIYGVLMFFTAAAFGWWVSRGHQAAPAPVTAPD
ncbi:hypothetical protein QYP00_27040 [Pseudomonas aeruginosa]|nr:hypothetical protein [Pseudomonas aeruginosa]